MSSPPVLQAQGGASVGLAAFWAAVAARLSTPEALRILGGGRVYRATEEEVGTPVAGSTVPWGRLVLVPTQTMWPEEEIASAYRRVGFLVRAEMNDFRPAPPATYDVARPLERLQQIAFEQLAGWLPAPATVGVVLRQALYRGRAPQGMPEWDGDREMWWISSEWRCEASRQP